MEPLFQYSSRAHTGQALQITEDTVLILSPFAVNGTVAIPVSSILEVVFHPIVKAEAGLGGWIKFVTADNRSLPVKNNYIGWEITCRDGVHKGQDLAAGNCFWYGCDYDGDGKGIVDPPNQEAEKAVALVKSMLPKQAPPSESSRKEEKRSFFSRLLSGRKNKE